jgi:acyl carrier protein
MKKIIDILETITGDESITLATELESINWDSMNVILFISDVEEQFDKTIEPDDIAQAKTVNDLVKLVH